MYKIVSNDKEIACKQSPHNVLMTMKFVFGRIIHENKNGDDDTEDNDSSRKKTK